MEKHGVVRTDNMWGTDVRAGLVSIKFLGSDGETPTEIDNGNVLKVGALMEGEREIYAGAVPAVDDALSDIVLIATPEVMYDERKHNLSEFYNEANKPCRGYRLHKGDVFSVTIDALDADDPAVGDFAELQADTKLAVVSEVTQGSTKVGTIIAIDVVGIHTYYAIRVD